MNKFFVKLSLGSLGAMSIMAANQLHADPVFNPNDPQAKPIFFYHPIPKGWANPSRLYTPKFVANVPNKQAWEAWKARISPEIIAGSTALGAVTTPAAVNVASSLAGSADIAASTVVGLASLPSLGSYVTTGILSAASLVGASNLGSVATGSQGLFTGAIAGMVGVSVLQSAKMD